MSDLDVPVADPADVRAEADRILALPEFRDDRNLIERAIDWVIDRLDGLVPDGAVGGGPGAVVVIILIAVAIAVLVIGVRALRRVVRERRARDDEVSPIVVLGEEVDLAEIDAAIAAAESRGEWRAALLARYRLMVAVLIGQGVVSDLPGRTTGEYRHEVGSSRPSSTDDFGAATAAFERAYYGAAPVEADDLDHMRNRVAAVVDREAVVR